MTDKPNTISDADWSRLQKAAAEATGSLIKNDDQKAKAATWNTQRDRAGSS